MDRSLASHIVRLALAAVLMAAALLAIDPLVRPLLAGDFELRVAGLALLVGGGVIVYAVAVFVTRAYTLAELKAFLRRKPKSEANELMRVVSGIQPTGNLHLGNYLGAIRRWVKLQDEVECLIFLADLHAITVYNDPAELRANVNGMAAALIACGIDPDKAVLFNHARVPAHPEMAWILSCTARMGWLNRMTQFKEKVGQEPRGRLASASTPTRSSRPPTSCSTRRPTSPSARTRSSMSS